jgi:large subunit ribosomal protein L19
MATQVTHMDRRGEAPEVSAESVYSTSKTHLSLARSVEKANSGPEITGTKILPGFAVYKPVFSVRSNPATKNPLPAWEVKQLALLDPTGARTQLFSRKRADSAKVGDVLRVTTKTGEPFAGVCLSIRRQGVDSAILLRGQMYKVGVEMWYKIYSPHVIGIDIIWRRPKRARRARLFYMRKPKHDMGSVDDLVFAWKKERAAARSKSKKPNQPLGTRF